MNFVIFSRLFLAKELRQAHSNTVGSVWQVANRVEESRQSIVDCLRFKGRHGWAGTNQIPIPIGIIDSRNGRPEFSMSKPWERERGLFPGIRVRPIRTGNRFDCVGCIFQGIIILRHAAFLDFGNFLSDRKQRFAISVQFSLRFAFRRFDHHGPGHWPGDCRSMEPKIHETFGNIFYFYLC